MSNTVTKTIRRARRIAVIAAAGLACSAAAGTVGAQAADCGTAADRTPVGSTTVAMPGRLPGSTRYTTMPNSFYAEIATTCLVNNERAAMGLPPLKWSNQLQLAASWGASQQSWLKAAWDTTHPGLDGSTIASRTQQYRTTFSANAQENAYYGWGIPGGTPRGAVQWWMGSPPHRAAILNPTWRFAGMAVREHTSNGGGYIMTFGDRG